MPAPGELSESHGLYLAQCLPGRGETMEQEGEQAEKGTQSQETLGWCAASVLKPASQIHIPIWMFSFFFFNYS